MSETIDRELKLLVESIIRPLPLPLSRQRRLRTEFLEHLQAIYSEELSQDGDPSAAFERTKLRFGNPSELTGDLRKTIPWWERGESWLERNLAQRPKESTTHYSLRLTACFMMFVSTLFALILFDHHILGQLSMTRLKVNVGAAALTFLSLWFSCFLLFGLQVGSEWTRKRRHWSRILLLWIGLLASCPIGLTILMMSAEGSFSEFAMSYASSLLGGLFSVGLGTVVGVLHQRDTAYRREWAELELPTA